MTFQEITLIGHLGKNPEMRYTQTGNPFTTFTLATNRVWNNSEGQKQTETTWWNITVFGNKAEPCNKYLVRGSKVLVQGNMNPNEQGYPRTFTRQDGSVGASYDIRAWNVQFLDNKEQGEALRAANGDSAPADETIPF